MSLLIWSTLPLFGLFLLATASACGGAPKGVWVFVLLLAIALSLEALAIAFAPHIGEPWHGLIVLTVFAGGMVGCLVLARPPAWLWIPVVLIGSLPAGVVLWEGRALWWPLW